MKWFCPYCWHEVKEEDMTCPNCGADLESFHRLDFDDKLILGLKNPIVQTRMFVIDLIGKRKVKRAVPELCKILANSSDTYELITTVNALFNIATEEAVKCIKEVGLNRKNKLLEHHIKSVFGETT